MVAYSTRFSLLAVFTFIAAMRVSALPAPLQSSALSIRQCDQPPQVALAARHSDKDERVTQLAAADDGDDDHSGSDADGNGSDSSDNAPSSSSTHERHHAKTSTNSTNQTSRTPRTARTTTSATATSTEHARHTKPVVPLPASMTKSGKKKAQPQASDGEDSNTFNDDDGGDDKNQSDSSKMKQTRETWAIDPMTRMRSLWMGARGMSARQVVTNGRLRAEKRHHHHHHNDHGEVVVKGDHDHVDVHERSIESDADGIVARSPHNDHGRVIVKGHNDHVHVHDNHDDDSVIVKGDDDHVHVHRSPSPHHHHHHDNDKVIVKGDNDSVRVHRRTPAPHRHHHHKIVRQGNHDRAHFRRSPEPHHHHHHHHNDDKVVVEGDHDQVSVHRRQARTRNTSPIFISGNGGNTYVMHPASTASSGGGLFDMMAGIGMNVKRDGQKEGVPGIIEILSQNANDQQGQKLASLVLASNSNDGDPDGSPFVLNASNSDRTVMYLVPVSPVNDTSVSAAAASATTSSTRSYLPVVLKTPVFVANSAQMEDYCATFDPRPVAPAPMTVERCMEGSSSDDHKSQVYAYDPQTGFVRPMWYEGEDDGTHDDSPSGTAVAGEAAESGGATSAVASSTMATSTATTTATSEATSSTGAESSGVTSLAQGELDDQYGSATQPATPAGLAKMLDADSLDLERAQNVTLIFTPSAPEVKLRLKADPVTTSGSADVPTTTDSSVSTITTTSSTSDLTTSSSATDVMSLAPTATSTTSMTSLETDTDTVPLSTSSPIPDSTPGTSDQPLLTDSSTLATFTSSPALEVKVYNPYANNLADTASSTVTVTFVSSSVDSATSTLVSDSNGSTMTPVSTAPYEWLFKQRSLE